MREGIRVIAGLRMSSTKKYCSLFLTSVRKGIIHFFGMELIIDIQGFKDKEGRFLPKEVVVMDVYKPRRQVHWIIKPPYPFAELPPEARLENERLTKYHHGIHWSEGTIKYDHFQMTLNDIVIDCSIYDCHDGEELIIYAKGHEVVEYLKKCLGRDIKNVDDEAVSHLSLDASLSSSGSSGIVCEHHRILQNTPDGMPFHCAVRNATILQHYLGVYSIHSLDLASKNGLLVNEENNGENNK